MSPAPSFGRPEIGTVTQPSATSTLRKASVSTTSSSASSSPPGRYSIDQSSQHSTRPDSSSSSEGDDGSSNSSHHVTSLSRPKRSLYAADSQQPASPGLPRLASNAASSSNGSNTTLPNFSRPSAPFMSHNETPARKASPLGPPPSDLQRHRPRQHSQGFFEPTLPTASLSEHASTMNNLTASQIAAQAAMQHQTSSAAHRHLRNRSQTTPSHETPPGSRKGSRTSPPPPPLSASHSQGPTHTTATNQRYQNGLAGNHALAATTAANVAFPRSPVLEQAPEKEPKHKGEKSKKKLFSKPKHIVISRDKDKDKDGEKKEKPLPSPNKMGFPGPSGLSRMVNASTASLNEPQTPSNSSMYNLSNTSAVTVVPADKHGEKEKDKDKHHKHHFLTRQKLKLKDKDEHFNLPLSSASSNSKPLDPNAPQSLYSFAPSSPGHVGASFGKTMTGLDLRHGARALREKKKEEKEKEKASAAAAMDIAGREQDQQDWLAAAANGAPPQPGASSVGSSSGGLYGGGDASLKDALQVFGLNNMTSDDAWDFLKVKLLVIFEGEDVRIAVEDLNKLVSIHVQRCVHKHMPSVIVEDLRELLQTGFASLNHSIHAVPDDRLVPHLVQIWLFVFGSILPFMQAVFLPLDLEFKGRGPVMSMREAKEFWGAPDGGASDTSIGDELDVRTIVLVSFRDNVILNRYETLKAIFSRLSLESINANVSSPTPNGGSGSGGRPSTAASLDPGFASYNSQSSTLLNAGTLGASYSSDGPGFSRSRATSNTSNPEQLLFQNQSFSPPKLHNPFHTGPADSSHLITETVGRMLQCISVLTSVQSGDQAQEQIELLSKALKHNWLGRGRTGRDRRGFVGTRVRPVPPIRQESDADSMKTIGKDDSSTIRGGGKWEASIRNSIPAGLGVGVR
ncbi:hypothetical protein FQN54_005242 [Arachnomyces sp. PD_36]|nr:hypothetical protein FQN54_005242 [Arachnomyces sp. PD_36]